MPGFAVQSSQGAICLPELDLWLDSRQARSGPERVFVSHAHSDHVARHREIIASPATLRLMTHRLGGRRLAHTPAFRVPAEFRTGDRTWRITLVSANHILGSAMGWIEWISGSLLYTGDFRLRAGRGSDSAEPRAADILIMETTFGRPQYRFPPADRVLAQIVQFCRDAINVDEVPVLVAYSLGKSQELLQGLAGAKLPVALHSAAYRITRVYEELGQVFPPFRELGAQPPPGTVVICPPGGLPGPDRRWPRTRTAVITGWAVDPSCRFRYGVDAAFPLSDHAGYDDLLALVQQVRPRRVYTVHGFAEDFASDLREIGVDAVALGKTEQLNLPLDFSLATRRPARATYQGFESNRKRL